MSSAIVRLWATGVSVSRLPTMIVVGTFLFFGAHTLLWLARSAVVYIRDRKAFKEDQKLWNVALQDARVMADLSRAMSRDGMREVRGYY